MKGELPESSGMYCPVHAALGHCICSSIPPSCKSPATPWSLCLPPHCSAPWLSLHSHHMPISYDVEQRQSLSTQLAITNLLAISKREKKVYE